MFLVSFIHYFDVNVVYIILNFVSFYCDVYDVMKIPK